jgi:16S rRNA (guanine527-N7)-methyltransferase
MNAGAELADGLAALDLALSSETRRRLLNYVDLLEKWNKVYNLTAVRGRAQMITHHVLDSLAVVPHIEAERLLDVGSGAGLPGIPYALARPDSHVTLLDANEKKAAFLRQAMIELELRNVAVTCARVEKWHSSTLFDAVVSRAFSDLNKFITLAGRLCAARGVLAAMKGAFDASTVAVAPGFSLKRVVRLEQT